MKSLKRDINGGNILETERYIQNMILLDPPPNVDNAVSLHAP